MKDRYKILIGIGIVVLILIILCYLGFLPFPFCCLFHNYVNINWLGDNSTNWECVPDDGGYSQEPPTYTCETREYPQCDGTCPPNEHCTAYYNIVTMEDGCTCEPDTDEQEPDQIECSDTDGYADIFNYGECTDGTGKYMDLCNYEQTHVTEYWCEDGVCVGASYQCGTTGEYGCAWGRCVDCIVECLNDGYLEGGYFSGGISCDDFEHYIINDQCCCYVDID